MAHEVKLDVFTIRIKEKNKRVSNESAYVGFDDFFKIPDADDDDNVLAFTEFFKRYIQSFDEMFYVDVNRNKAIALDSERVVFGSGSRTISGAVDGGVTGIGTIIKERDKIKDEDGFQVPLDSVQSIPYYFLFWIPSDSNVGLLIMQSLASSSVSDVFISHLRKFVADNTDYSLIAGKHVPKEAEKKLKDEGIIRKVTLRRSSIDNDRAKSFLQLDYMDEPITIEVHIKGLNKIPGYRQKLKDYMSGVTPRLVELDFLSDIGMDDSTETLVEFEHAGKKATGKASNNFQLAPSYYLDERDVYRNDLDHPNHEKLDEYCRSFLDKMKIEIGYTTS